MLIKPHGPCLDSAAYTKYAPKLSEGGMKVWGIKERWSPDYLYVVGCLDLPEHCAALILLWLHLVEIVLTSQHNWECCQKKSTAIRNNEEM